MFTLIRTIVAVTFKGTCALALGGAILGMVVRNCDRRDGVAYVHVAATGVDVTVGGIAYHVAGLEDSPIVCALPAGPHVVRIYRAGTVVHEQAFVLEPGRELVLCAWDGPAVPRTPAGVTVAARRPRP